MRFFRNDLFAALGFFTKTGKVEKGSKKLRRRRLQLSLEPRAMLTVNVTADTQFVPEGATAVIHFTLEPESDPVTIGWTTRAGIIEATAGLDYEDLSGSISLSASSPEAVVEIDVFQDAFVEEGERFHVQIVSVDGVPTETGASTPIDIIDDDLFVNLPTDVNEGELAELNGLTLCADLVVISGLPGGEISFDPSVDPFFIPFVFADDNPTDTPVDTYTITVAARRMYNGEWIQQTRNINVHDLAPILSLDDEPIVFDSLEAPTVATLEGAYDDAGINDTHDLTVIWGDGFVQTVAVSGGAFSVNRPLQLAPDEGVEKIYPVEVILVDDDTLLASQVIQGPRVNLTIYDGLNPSNPAAVSDVLEFTDGAYTVANQNDTDGDGFIDNTEDDWFEGGGVGTAIGENEKDLVKIVLDKPIGYIPGTVVNVVLGFSYQSMRVWEESTRQTLLLDGTESPTGIAQIDVSFDTRESFEMWLELMHPSTHLRDYGVTATYRGSRDVVSATAVWASILDYESGIRTHDAVFAEAPWSFLGNFGPVSAGVAMHGGTGVRPIHSTHGLRNVIVQAWEPTPLHILTVPRVKFDITRRVDSNTWERTDGAFQLVRTKEMPVKLDQPNDDDPLLLDEDAQGGLFFVYDAPGYAPLPGASSPISEVATRMNFEEFVRIRVDGVTPSGNDVIVGSRGSYKFLWHSRTQAKRVGDAWARVAAFDSIGAENDYETIPTPG